MQNGDWNKVKDVLDEALAMPVRARKAYFDRAGLSDAVRREVESLLAFEAESADLMQLSAVEFSQDFGLDGAADLAGQEVGPYRLIREIGGGGMGAVYLAERIDGKFRQQVALKLLKREMNTGSLRRYFEQEREILASLEHPNIARLLDAGATDENVPFIAMEYVDGIPIDEYCSAHGLDLYARLRLFRTVCSAVEYAHRSLVIHRDLKPSNILVTHDGVPKLLDFGISKILTPDLKTANTATITRLGLMTPSYASPEQLQQSSVTTLSDVYSLGVILFELLSGRRPFEQKEGNLREIYSAVIEEQPIAPSSVIESETRPATGGPVARQRGSATASQASGVTGRANNTVPRHLVRGDLDNIVLKALRKEPERRYESVGQLSEDIRRHLAGLTVTARPNTFGYRAGKFVARNRVGVAAAVIVLLAIAAGVVATLWQARVAGAERERAERQFNDVRTLANSFLFEFSPKIEKLPGSTPARQLLVTRALEYLDRLSQESSADAELRAELAKAYEKVGDVQGSPFDANIGDTAGALDSYAKSLAIRNERFAGDPDSPSLKRDVAYVNKAIGQIHSLGGDYGLARPHLDTAVQLYEEIAAADPTVENRAKLAEMYRTRGLLPFYESDNKQAIEYYNKARVLSEQLITEAPNDVRVADQHAYIYVAIGEARGWDSDFEGASGDLQKGLDLLIGLVARFPNDTPLKRSLMLAYNKRAENFQDLEQFDTSVATFEEGIAIAREMRKADPTSVLAIRDVAMTYKKLAQAMRDAGRVRESIEQLRYAVAQFGEIAAIDPANTEAPYDVANTRLSLARSLLTDKQLDAAFAEFKRAETGFAAVLERNPANTYAVRMSTHNFEGLGRCYMEMAKSGKRDENLKAAGENFRIALERFKSMQAHGTLQEDDIPRIAAIEQLLVQIDQARKV